MKGDLIMKCTVVGKQKMSFKNDKGEMINIAKLSVIHKFAISQNTETDGEHCSEVIIPFEFYDDISVNDKLLLDFDRQGKILDIEIL